MERVDRPSELARLAQLVEDATPVLVVGLAGSGKRTLIDMLRRHRDDVQLVSVEEVMRGARPERAVAMAERRVDGWPGGVLRLACMQRQQALAMWRRLDDTRGTVPGFRAAWQRSGGHPGSLVAMHEGLLHDARLLAVVAGLTDEEKRAATTLALHGAAAPIDLFGGDVAASLVDQLIFEPVGVGWVKLAVPLRAALIDAAAGVTPVEQSRLWDEVARRLCDPARAAQELGPRLAERCLASLPAERRSPALRSSRARLLFESLELRRALAIIDDVRDAGELRAELKVHAGAVKRLDSADGDFAALAAFMRGERGGAALPPADAPWSHLWADNDDGLERALHELTGDERPTACALMGIAAARAGQTDEARELQRRLVDRFSAEDHPRLALLAELVGAMVELAMGRRRYAREQLAAIAARLDVAGEVPLALTVRLEEAAALHLLGHRFEATSRIREVEARAQELGLAGLNPAIARAKAAELSRAVWRIRNPTHLQAPGLRFRHEAATALRVAFAGHEVACQVALEALEALPPDVDFAVERMLAAVARSALARVRGAEDEAQRHIADATRHAAWGGVDGDTLAALVSVLGRERVVTPTGRRLAAAGTALTHRSLVIDAVRHEIRAEPGVVITLDRRPVLARLLYALAANPNDELDKDALTLRLWGVPYNPLVHDNALKANVHRLNRMIAPAKISVSFGDHGYRLHGPPDLVFVERPSVTAPAVSPSYRGGMVGAGTPEH